MRGPRSSYIRTPDAVCVGLVRKGAKVQDLVCIRVCIVSARTLAKDSDSIR